MSDLLFPLAAPTLPVLGEARVYPVGRIFCVGRNYAAHAREMGGDPNREPPFFFMKPADAAISADMIPFPKDTANLHHEVELVVALGEGGRIFGYAVGVDLTKRDRQDEAKAAARPWERSKSFERAAPISAVTPSARAISPEAARIRISVNGAVRQDSSTANLIWSVPEILERLGQAWDLKAGDLIFTGTPEGVGPMQREDWIEAEVEGVAKLAFRFV